MSTNLRDTRRTAPTLLLAWLGACAVGGLALYVWNVATPGLYGELFPLLGAFGTTVVEVVSQGLAIGILYGLLTGGVLAWIARTETLGRATVERWQSSE